MQCCYLPNLPIPESYHDNVINSQQKREILIETGQAIDRGRLQKVFPATSVLLIQQNNWNSIKSDVRKYQYRRVITSQGERRDFGRRLSGDFRATSRKGRVVYYLRHYDVRVVTILRGWVSHYVESSLRRHQQMLIYVRWTMIMGFWLQ